MYAAPGPMFQSKIVQDQLDLVTRELATAYQFRPGIRQADFCSRASARLPRSMRKVKQPAVVLFT
jgi:hypothetical protein